MILTHLVMFKFFTGAGDAGAAAGGVQKSNWLRQATGRLMR
jgi:hypothetical protein